MNKIIENYSKKSLKKNKFKRNLIILAIALSTFFISTLGILVTSFKETTINNTKVQYGFENGIFLNLNDDKFDVLMKHIMVKDVGKLYPIKGMEYTEDSKKKVKLFYIPTSYKDFFGIKLEKGTVCEKQDEIIISKELNKELNKNIDDYITFNDKTFKIKGIIGNTNISDLNAKSVLVSEAYFNNIPSSLKINNTFFRLKNEDNLTTDIETIGKDLGVDKENIILNSQLINTLQFKIEDSIPFVILGFIVLVVSIISIYNIFNISVTERTQEFGLLLALGATKSNINSILRREGIILCCIGIPFGLIVSIIGSFAIIPNIPISSKVCMKISLISIVIAIVVVIVSVLISLSRPSRNACRVSPLSAINYIEGEANIGKKTKKGQRVINSSKLSRINLLRNKKRTVFTILSLTMSAILFIIFSTIVSSMNLEKLIKNTIIGDYEIRINLNNQVEEDLLDDREVDDIKLIHGVRAVNTIKAKDISLDNFKNSIIAGYSKQLLNKCTDNIVSGEFNIEKMKKENGVLLVSDKHKESLPKVGDKVKIKYKNRVDKNNIRDEEKEFVVQGIINKEGWKLGYSSLGVECITSQEIFTHNFGEHRNTRVAIDVDNGKNKEIENYLIKYRNKSSLKVNSIDEELQKIKREKGGVELIGYSAVAIIGIIGFINMINTTITNIISRKKELAVLEGIGLTNKDITMLLTKESLYYVIISSGLGLVVGVPSSYLLFILFKRSATYAQYEFPLIPIAIMILIMVVLQGLCVKLVQRRISKGSIVDNIKFN